MLGLVRNTPWRHGNQSLSYIKECTSDDLIVLGAVFLTCSILLKKRYSVYVVVLAMFHLCQIRKLAVNPQIFHHLVLSIHSYLHNVCELLKRYFKIQNKITRRKSSWKLPILLLPVME